MLYDQGPVQHTVPDLVVFPFFVVHLGMNVWCVWCVCVSDNGNIIAKVEGHTNKHLDSVRRRTASALSRTIAGQEENAGNIAHAGTSVGLFAAMKRIVRCKLDITNISAQEFGIGDLIVGSDKERALTKAVETCLPQAPTLLCCRHLEENVQRRLQDKVGVSAQVRQDIVRRVWC